MSKCKCNIALFQSCNIYLEKYEIEILENIKDLTWEEIFMLVGMIN